MGRGQEEEEDEEVQLIEAVHEFDWKLVEITGVADKVKVREDSQSRAGRSLDPNGKKGRAYWMGDGQYGVHTFDGLYLTIPEASLSEFDPGDASAGGFDLAWPGADGDYESFAFMVGDVVATKGYCVIQTFEGEETRTSMMQAARLRSDFTIPFPELEESYLGKDAKSKVAWLESFASPEEAEGDPEAYYNQYVQNLGYILAPVASGILGFQAWDKLGATMLRTPLMSAGEREMLSPGPLNKDAVEAGQVEKFLDWIQRRRLCMMYIIQTEGGSFELLPREGFPYEDVTIPLQKDKLILFRHDVMSYSYQPRSIEDLVLQCWLMEVPQELEINGYEGGQAGMQEVLSGGPPTDVSEQVHIMCGMCRFPGQSHRLNKAWLAFASCTDTFTESPIARFDFSPYYTEDSSVMGKSLTKHWGSLSDDELMNFDHKFFGIDEGVAHCMVPIQRVLIEVAYEALDLVGFDRKNLTGKQIALLIGDIAHDWDAFHGFREVPEAWLHGASVHGVSSANRLAMLFGTTGPVHQVDTACSSTLVGTNMGHKMLETHSHPGVNWALSMGLQCITTPWSFIGLSAAGMLGRSGRSLTFDQSANGYNRGEGAGGLILKTSDSTQDVEERLAAYVGSFINQDGRSASLTAPNGPSQQACIRSSIRLAKVSLEKVSVNENHGTGTALGDPIECGSVRSVFRKQVKPLPLTSAKSHMGHLEAVAGSVGLIKSLVAITHSAVPPNVHLRHLNAHIETEGFPGLFPIEMMDLAMRHSIGSLNSFGFGGTNSRADVWARCLIGTQETGGRAMEVHKLDFITVTCPRCQGQMGWLDGVAVPQGATGKHHCVAIRDERASYDYCSNCYSGPYMYGGEAATIQDTKIDKGGGVCLSGTWSAWSTLEEMEQAPDGSYYGEVTLGETCVEQFHIVLRSDPTRSIRPVVPKANARARVEGPDRGGQGRSWLIDGRREGLPAGTTYAVRFAWEDRKWITWEPIPDRAAEPAGWGPEGYPHAYAIEASFTGWGPRDMAKSLDEPGLWEFTAALRGKSEEFRFVRDRDPSQMIYPPAVMASSSDVPVVGPDEGGAGKAFAVYGTKGEKIHISLRVKDGDIAVSASTQSMGEVTWQSLPGRTKDTFHITGSHNGWSIDPLGAVPNAADVYAGQFLVGPTGSEEFQIVVNQSWNMRMHPDAPFGLPGVASACGPDSNSNNLSWQVSGAYGETVEVTLDLGAEDQAGMVTCASRNAWLEDEA